MDLNANALIAAGHSSGSNGLAQAAAGGKDPMQAAKEFESVFLSNYLSSMFSGLSTEAPFGGGHAEETWRGFLVQGYAEKIVENGGIGIAESVYRELIALQEASDP